MAYDIIGSEDAMEPFSLRCFVAVARSGSFSRAAEELYRTQPAVSLQVRKLERELGQRLFDRSRRSPVMTDVGRALYPGARDLLQRLDRLPELAAVSGAEPAGTLTIASNLSLIGHFLPRAVHEFHGRHPRVRLRFLNRTSRGIARALDDGEADIGIGFLVEERAEMESAVLFRSPFALVTARTLRGSARVLSLDTVLAGPVIHFEEGVEVRRFLEQALTGRRSLQPVIRAPLHRAYHPLREQRVRQHDPARVRDFQRVAEETCRQETWRLRPAPGSALIREQAANRLARGRGIPGPPSTHGESRWKLKRLGTVIPSHAS